MHGIFLMPIMMAIFHNKKETLYFFCVRLSRPKFVNYCPLDRNLPSPIFERNYKQTHLFPMIDQSAEYGKHLPISIQKSEI